MGPAPEPSGAAAGLEARLQREHWEPEASQQAAERLEQQQERQASQQRERVAEKLERPPEMQARKRVQLPPV
jgi:hypothetical protein